MERLRIRREVQEAKKRAAEAKKEAEGGSVNTAGADCELPTQKSKAGDAEPTEDTSSQGKKNERLCLTMLWLYLFLLCR